LRNIDEIMEHIPETTVPITVYKGVNLTGLNEFRYDHYFSSTSVCKDIATIFAGGDWQDREDRDLVNDLCCIFEITILPGSKIIPLFGSRNVDKNISGVLANELEIILDRGKRIKIEKEIQPIKGSMSTRGGTFKTYKATY
jgi:hypothetical protein